MNAVSWFLSVCAFLYIVFPFLLNAIKKIPSVRHAVFCMCLIFTIQGATAYYSHFLSVPISDNFHKWFTYICPVYRLGDFCIGGLLGYIWLKKSKKYEEFENNNRIIGTLMEVVALSLFLIAHMIYVGEISISAFRWLKYSCLYLPSSLLMVWVFSAEQGVITRTIHYKWLLFIGNISAYAYLIHQIVISYIDWFWVSLFNTHIGPFMKVGFSLIITIILSVLFERHKKDVFKRCENKIL